MEVLQILKNNTTLSPFEQSLVDKVVSLPPNEIVTKDYEPDQKPLMKLITYQEMIQSQKNITYAPGKVKNQQLQKYSKLFRPTDFLGYHYSQKLHQMVYFRYNNERFNELIDQDSEKSTRYFGGMFIPLKFLESKEFKQENNIYSALNLSVPEIKDAPANSFTKNSKGCPFDPLFSSNFSSGNMMAAIRKNPFEYDIILQNDTNCKASEWFNFAVKFIEEGTYKFNIVNLSNENPLYRYGMKVPYYSFFQQGMKAETLSALKAGEGWSFGGKNINFFKTQIRKEGQDQESTYYCLSFQYKCNYRQDIVIFTSSIPYTAIDYESFLNRMVYNKVGQYMKMEKVQVCQTLAGTPLSAYIFSHRKSKFKTALPKGNQPQSQKLSQDQRPNEKQKSVNLKNFTVSTSEINTNTNQNLLTMKTIVILARQHPGETSASFILEGVIEFIMENAQFDAIKKNFQFVVVPFVNPDGIKYGNQRVNLAGSDSKRSWENPNQIFEPQVYNLKKLLKTIDQMHPISLLINLSSTNQKYFFVKFSLYSYFKSCSNKKFCDEIPELFPYLVSKRVSQISFKNSEFSPFSKPSFANTLSEIFPKSLVYDFKTSLYGWTTQISGQKKQGESLDGPAKLEEVHEFTPEIYRNMGKQFMGTYFDYLRLCSKNIGVRERWSRQIEELSVKINEQIQANQQKYEANWTKDLVKLDFSLFSPPPKPKSKPDSKIMNIRKHKSMVPYRNGSVLQQLKAKSKKKSMQFLRNIIGSNDEKDNKTIEPDSVTSSFDQLDKKKYSPSMNQLNNQLSKSSQSSTLFTQKHKKQLINKISQAIRESSLQKKIPVKQENNNNKFSDSLLAMVQKRQKKLPGLIRKKGKLNLNEKMNTKDLPIKDKSNESSKNFNSLKRSIPLF